MERIYSDAEIKSMLDLKISYRKNLENLKNNGVKIGDHKLQKLLNEKKSESGIISYTDEEIKELIDINQSVRKNLTILQEKSIKIGKDKLQKLLREKKSEVGTIANNVPDEPEAIEEETITTLEIKEEIQTPSFNISDFSKAFGSFNSIQEKKPEPIEENKTELQKMASGINAIISATKNDPDPDVKDEEVDPFPYTLDPFLKERYNSRKEMKEGQEKAAEESDLKLGETPTFNLSFPSYFS